MNILRVFDKKSFDKMKKVSKKGFTPASESPAFQRGDEWISWAFGAGFQPKSTRKLRPLGRRGFTLVEILVVVTIIGVLAQIVISQLTTGRKKAKIAKAKIEIKQIFNAVSMLEIDSEQWPGHKTIYEIETGAAGNEICADGCTFDLNDCRAGLVCDDGANPYPNWRGPYMEEVRKDPWGNEYFLDTDYDIDPGAGEEWAVVLGSYGPNGQGLNLYDSDDVIYVIVK